MMGAVPLPTNVVMLENLVSVSAIRNDLERKEVSLATVVCLACTIQLNSLLLPLPLLLCPFSVCARLCQGPSFGLWSFRRVLCCAVLFFLPVLCCFCVCCGLLLLLCPSVSVSVG
jgi:hypothetical protein